MAYEMLQKRLLAIHQVDGVEVLLPQHRSTVLGQG